MFVDNVVFSVGIFLPCGQLLEASAAGKGRCRDVKIRKTTLWSMLGRIPEELIVSTPGVVPPQGHLVIVASDDGFYNFSCSNSQT